MSYYDGIMPTYTVSFCIERSDRVLIDTTVEVQATAKEINKAKKTIQRLMNEYAPVAKAPTPKPESAELATENQAPIGQADLPSASESSPTPLLKKKPEGAKGLLRLHCSECGNTFGAFLREYQTEMMCKCGHPIDLTGQLGRYRFTCPYCQHEGFGKTNLEDPDITVRCKCGEDIDLRWAPNQREYTN
ncbi:MAG: hypothetical protein HFF00_04900 [Ruminiclostridium sp.]|jgi:hypothetical protein|nr:hypothetical protein [Ruminiclostridium sp.]